MSTIRNFQNKRLLNNSETNNKKKIKNYIEFIFLKTNIKECTLCKYLLHFIETPKVLMYLNADFKRCNVNALSVELEPSSTWRRSPNIILKRNELRRGSCYFHETTQT